MNCININLVLDLGLAPKHAKKHSLANVGRKNFRVLRHLELRAKQNIIQRV